MMPASTTATIDGWRLHGTVLTPTLHRLQAYTIALLHQRLPDPLLTFRFPEGVLTFHRSYLTKASSALRALVSVPFMEATSRTITLHYESFQAFRVIRDFLYLTPIDMTQIPLQLPLVADRWGLHQLFHAYLAFIRSHQWPSFNHFMNACLPLLQLPTLPPQFKRSLAIKFATSLPSLQSWICESRSELHHLSDSRKQACVTSRRRCRNAPSEFVTSSEIDCSRTCQQSRFRESVVWQALHKQRMIPRFIKYIKLYHNNNTFNYLTFITHGLYDVLNAVITEKHVAKIMSCAVSLHVPRMLSTSRVQKSPTVQVLCAGGHLYINIIGNVLIRQTRPFPGRQGFNLRAVSFRVLLSDPVKSVCNEYGERSFGKNSMK